MGMDRDARIGEIAGMVARHLGEKGAYLGVSAVEICDALEELHFEDADFDWDVDVDAIEGIIEDYQAEYQSGQIATAVGRHRAEIEAQTQDRALWFDYREWDMGNDDEIEELALLVWESGYYDELGFGIAEEVGVELESDTHTEIADLINEILHEALLEIR